MVGSTCSGRDGRRAFKSEGKTLVKFHSLQRLEDILAKGKTLLSLEPGVSFLWRERLESKVRVINGAFRSLGFRVSTAHCAC